MSIVFSGIQPTGNLHLGNYLGAIKNWQKMQNDYNCIFCIVDMHAITVPQNPVELKNSIYELAAIYLACGIDPKKNIIFPQSAVSGHAELAWILGCSTPMGWLERMTQFKDKTQSIKESIIESTEEIKEALKIIKIIVEDNYNRRDGGYYFPSGALEKSKNNIANINILADLLYDAQRKSNSARLGLFSYPVLMAADILLYKATNVPVGDDQKQHLELAREIANSFNFKYNQEFFPQPEPLITGTATRVMSLNDGTRKMSKSEESDYSRINLSDDADVIRKKFQKAKSDSFPEITYDKEARPDIANLLTIYAALGDITIEAAAQHFLGKRSSDLKKELADLAVEKLAPITAEFNKLKQDRSYLKSILDDGANRANKIAEKNIREIKDLIGFY
jgi:tryptophanyl-tRNA synthetase